MAPENPDPILIETLVVEFLTRGMSVEFEVTGSSMAPFIQDHDVVEVVPVDVEEVGLGDVVVWSRVDDRLVVHRLVTTSRGRLRTRGDALRDPDGHIRPGRLIGKVIALRRNGRPVGLGLGPERLVLAWLSRMGVLSMLLRLGRRFNPRAG